MCFFKYHAENEVGRLVPGLFNFQKALYQVKGNGQHLSFNIFWQNSTWTYNKNKLYNISKCISRNILNFDFSGKGYGVASPAHFIYDFFMLYSINCPNLIVWLTLLPEILGNMCIVIISCPVYEVINFETNQTFLSSGFLHK